MRARFGRDRADNTPALLGLGTVGLVTVLLGRWTDLVGISWYAVAPLVTSALGAEVAVAVVAAVAILATVAAGLEWTSLDGPQLATRTATVAVVGGVAVVLAHQRERREQRLRSRRIVERLASFTEVLAAAASSEAVATVVAEHGRTALGADTVLLYLRAEPGEPVALAAGGSPEPGRRADGAGLLRRLPVELPNPASDAVRERHPIVLTSRAELERRYPQLPAELGGGGLLAVPLPGLDEPVGALCFAFHDREPAFDTEDLDVASVMAAQCAQALERARLFRMLDERGRSAVVRARRAEFLDELTTAFATALDVRSVAAGVLAVGLPAAAARAGAVYLLDPLSQRPRLLAARAAGGAGAGGGAGAPARGGSWAPPAPLRVAVDDAVQLRQPALHPLGPDQEDLPGGSRLWVAWPLVAYGHVVGVLGLAYRDAGELDDDHRSTLTGLGQRAAEALERARLYEGQRDIATQLQDALLPGTLPSIDGVRTAARYRPAGAAAGGDWYDVTVVGAQRLVIALGDVAGHGITAAASMGRFRSALRAHALAGDSPTSALGNLQRFVLADEVTTMATVVCCLLDVPARRLVYSSAGHLAPILADRAGARLLPAPQGPPVGVRFEGRYEEVAVTFDPPATLVFYSDGLVERRGHALDHDMEHLRALVEANAHVSPDELCDVLLDVLLDVEVPDDDVALLAVRIDGPGPTPAGSPS